MFIELSSELRPFAIFGDERLNQRFEKIVKDLGQAFGQSIPTASNSRAEMKGAYNFFSHKNVTHEGIIATERDRTLNHLNQYPRKRILSVQDTSEIDLTNKRVADKIGCLNTEYRKGFFLHHHYLLDDQGVPIGILDQYYWSRTKESLGKMEQRRRNPIEEKESYRWIQQFEFLVDCFEDHPQTQVIHICDREADIHELLQLDKPAHIHYVIRSKHNRKQQEQDEKIRQALEQRPFVGSYVLNIGARGKDKPRKATIQVRYGSYTIHTSRRPKGQTQLKPIKLQLVEAIEIDPPKGVEPVNWVLLTDLEVESFEQAMEIIRLYVLRWRIETFFYILKKGGEIEELQLKEPSSVLNAITTYSIIAVMVQKMRYTYKEYPETKIEDLGFNQEIYKLAARYVNKNHKMKVDINKTAPTITDFAPIVAKIGGSMLWKHQPFGVESLWKGIATLRIILQAYYAFRDD